MAGHPAVGWGNPFNLKDYAHLPTSPEQQRHICILDYTAHLLYGSQAHLLTRLPELEGKVLGCWCRPRLCHGHVLTYLAHHIEFF